MPEVPEASTRTQAISQNSKDASENNQEILELQNSLTNKLLALNKSKKNTKQKLIQEVQDIIDSIESKKSPHTIQGDSESEEIVESLEYQTCLAIKFCQMMLAMYKCDTDSVEELLKDYPLSDIVYDLYIHYIIKDSQTSNKSIKENIFSNEVFLFIKNVLLKAIKDQNTIDELVVKILTNFVLDCNPVYSQARIIESIEHLPYNYGKVLEFAYSKLQQDNEATDEVKSVQEVLDNLRGTLQSKKSKESIQSNDKIKLLMTTLVLNNLKAQSKREEMQGVLDTLMKIINWIIQNKSLDLDNKKFLLSMCLDLMLYLVKAGDLSDCQKVIQQKGFLTQLTLTNFLLNSASHNQYLDKIFDSLHSRDEIISENELKVLTDNSQLDAGKNVLDRIGILSNSFTFWENIVDIMLKQQQSISAYLNSSRWMENLIFSITKLLEVSEVLRDIHSYAQANLKLLRIDPKQLNSNDYAPKYEVIVDLVNLLKSARNVQASLGNGESYTKSQLMSLWSLVFEILSRVESEWIFDNNILSDIISTLLDSSINLQEIAYLAQTEFKVQPKPKFACALIFEILNKSIDSNMNETT